MKKAIFFFMLILLAFSVVGDTFVVTKGRFPTISVTYQEKEEITILNRTLFMTGLNKEYELIDNSSNPFITDSNPYDGVLNYTYLFKPKTPLEDGQYVFTIIASDKVGNNRTKVQNFEVKIPFENITLVNPPHGVTSVSPFDLRILTSAKMEGCRYQLSPSEKSSFTLYKDLQTSKFSSTDNLNFYIYNFNRLGDTQPYVEDVPLYMYVTCNNTLGITNDGTPKEFVLLLDNSKPVIRVTPSPNPVVNDPITVNVIAQSLPFSNNIFFQNKIDKVNCRFSNSIDASYDNMEYKFYQDDSFFNETNSVTLNSLSSIPLIENGKTYNFYVQCKNRAGLLSDVTNVSFSVDTSLGSNITYFAPSGYISVSNPLLNVTTNRPATCSYTKSGDKSPSQFLGSDKYHTASLSGLSDGKYTYYVLCDFPGAQSRAATISFTVDTTPPNPPTVTPSPACSQKEILAKITSQDSDIKRYQYALTDGTSLLTDYTNGTASNNEYNLKISGLNLKVGTVYYLKVIAYDYAGNPSNEVTSAIESLDSTTNTLCTEKVPPTLGVTFTTNSSEATITFSCVDNSGCKEVDYSYVGINDNCGVYTDTYISPFKVYTSGKLCYIAQDTVGNSVSGSKIIYLQNPVDNDSDGFPAGIDCNDNNSSINPNATEIPYDGIDQNCKGYDLADVDGDGYCKKGYIIQNAVLQCPKENGTIGTDSNDFNANINPGETEVCSNGIDDNGNGFIDCKDTQCANDTACRCTIGSWTSCGPDKGACANSTGTMTCEGTGVFGLWSDCKNPAVPKPENCSNGVDDNCDGLTDCNDPTCSNDPACTCYPGSKLNCGINVGACTYGVKTCQLDNTWGACEGGNPFPTTNTETDCGDGVDNDCNGLTDCKDPACSLSSNCVQCSPDNATDICGDSGNNTQICQQGTRTCHNGVWGSCIGLVLPSPNICNNNVYDGCVGEVGNCTITPEPQKDMDGDGYTVAQGDCNDLDSSVHPGATEVCNGIDDNCNGLIDENCKATDNSNNNAINTTGETVNQNTDNLNNVNTTEVITVKEGYLKQHFIGIVLLILGLVMILGAGGYLLYKKYMKKDTVESSSQLFGGQNQGFQTQNTQAPNPAVILQKQRLEQERMQQIMKKRIEMQNELFAKKREVKSKERKGILSSFDTGDKKSEATPATERKQEVTPTKGTNKAEESRKIMTGMIKKQQEQKNVQTPTKEQSGGANIDEKLESIINKESAFDSLEKIGKTNSKEQIKNKLNTLTHTKSTDEKLEGINLKSHADAKELDKLIEKQSNAKDDKDVFKELSKVKESPKTTRKQGKKTGRK